MFYTKTVGYSAPRNKVSFVPKVTGLSKSTYPLISGYKSKTGFVKIKKNITKSHGFEPHPYQFFFVFKNIKKIHVQVKKGIYYISIKPKLCF